MVALNERYVLDREGNRVEVILPIHEYEALLAELEEIEDIRAFDQAEAEGGEAIAFEQAIEEIEKERGQ